MEYSGSKEICPNELMDSAASFPWDTAVNALALTAILALAILLIALGFLSPVRAPHTDTGVLRESGQISFYETTGSPGRTSPELEILP